MKKVLIAFAVVILVAVGIGAGLYFTYLYPFMKKMNHVTTISYDKQLTLVIGGGGNSGILVSDSAVLVIDTKMNDAAQKLYDQVKQLAGNKPIIVVNTHIHTDHTGGNKFYKGQTIIAGGNYDKDFWDKDAGADSKPTVWVKDSLVLNIGDETVTILNLPFSVHTQSDVVVYLHNRKMLFGGDVILNHQFPVLFAKYNADANGYLKAFDLVQSRFEIAKVVPGHGDVGGPEVIDNYRNFFNDMFAASTADEATEKTLQAKYSDWNQIPMVMSPSATIKYIKNGKAK
jgi:cyclase